MVREIHFHGGTAIDDLFSRVENQRRNHSREPVEFNGTVYLVRSRPDSIVDSYGGRFRIKIRDFPGCSLQYQIFLDGTGVIGTFKVASGFEYYRGDKPHLDFSVAEESSGIPYRKVVIFPQKT